MSHDPDYEYGWNQAADLMYMLQERASSAEEVEAMVRGAKDRLEALLESVEEGMRHGGRYHKPVRRDAELARERVAKRDPFKSGFNDHLDSLRPGMHVEINGARYVVRLASSQRIALAGARGGNHSLVKNLPTGRWVFLQNDGRQTAIRSVLVL